MDVDDRNAGSGRAGLVADEPHPSRVDDRPVLAVSALSYTYGGVGGVAALTDVAFTVDPGEFVSVVGPSGCGKSTLLAAVAGLLRDCRGEIRFRESPVVGPQDGIGVVFQEDATFPWRTTRRNVEFGLEMAGVGRAERSRRAHDMLRLVGLEEFADAYPSQLSGGMRQRLAIARTLVTEPELLLMDEPFGALDEQTRLLLGEELLRLQRLLGQTILFITHSIQESVLLSDRIVLLSKRPGQIKDIVPIDLPTRRGPELMATPEFTGLVSRVWTSIREESVRTEQPAG